MTWLHIIGAIVALGVSFYLGMCVACWKTREVENWARKHWKEANDRFTKALLIQTDPERYQPLKAIAEWYAKDNRHHHPVIWANSVGWHATLSDENADGTTIRVSKVGLSLVDAAELALKRLRGDA